MDNRFIFFLILSFLAFMACEGGKLKEHVPPALPNLESIEHSIYSSILAAKIDSLFMREYSNGQFIGAGISIVIDDKTAYEKTFGYSNVSTQEKLDLSSIFRIGSLSKSFTGVVSGILYQEGIINFTDIVHEKLPSFRLQIDSFTNSLELGHLLSHTGGFPYHSYTNLVEDNLTMRRIIPYFKQISNLKPPGSLYSYQNAAFAISGEYMAAANNTAVDQLYVDKLFKPLEMNSSSVDFKSIKNTTNVALPHGKGKRGWTTKKLNKKYYNAIPAGGINTSTSDMSKFLNLLLGNNPSLLTEKSLDAITEPRIRTKVRYRYYKKWPHFEDSFYSIGWRVHTFRNPRTNVIDTLIHHGGMVNGYRSEMAFNRKERFAISVMFNSTTPLARTVIPKIIKLIMNAKTGKNTI